MRGRKEKVDIFKGVWGSYRNSIVDLIWSEEWDGQNLYFTVKSESFVKSIFMEK